jgi:hypothetical protein
MPDLTFSKVPYLLKLNLPFILSAPGFKLGLC